MSFIATDPIAASPKPTAPASVTNDGFFPDIDLQRLRGAVRLDGTVTTDRLRKAVVEAVISVNDELASWKARQQLAGVATLGQLEPKIDGEAIQLHRYLTAIYSTVKADLNEKFRNFDATKSGVDEADKLLEMVEDERRAARWAIRDFLGQPRTTVELI
jgi:hypothetical protein